MTINASELILYRSAVFNDTETNGGSMSYNAIESNIDNNVWPNIFKIERVQGSTKYRKIYGKVRSASYEILHHAQFWVDTITQGDDWVIIFSGAPNTQNDITGNERCYGCGKLNADVSGGVDTLLVDVESSTLKVSGSDPIFAANDVIRITNKATPDSLTGTEEFHEVLSVTDVPSANRVSIVLKSKLKYSYFAADTRVMSVYDVGDIIASVNTVVFTGTGAFDNATYPITVENIGCSSESWTLTFTDATHVNIVGSLSGTIGTEVDITSDISIANANTPTKSFWTINHLAWSGTQVAGNTLTFNTVAATAAIWEKRVVPAGASSTTNSTTIVFTGETI